MTKSSRKIEQPSPRMTDREHPPGNDSVASWIGPAHKWWKRTADWIAETYPGTFFPEWLFGGANHGWSLRYKKSKSFCTFVPEKNRFLLVIVFGADERARVEGIRATLSKGTLQRFDEATTYHDGKWLVLPVEDEAAFADGQRLLVVKRSPRARSRLL